MDQQIGKMFAVLLQFTQAGAQVIAVVNFIQLLEELREAIAEHMVLLAHEFRKASFFRAKTSHHFQDGAFFVRHVSWNVGQQQTQVFSYLV